MEGKRKRDAEIVIASSVLMATTNVTLASEVTPTPLLAALAIVGFMALASRPVAPVTVIVLSACLGPLLVR